MYSVLFFSLLFIITVLFVGKYTRFHVPDNDKEIK